MEVSIGRGGDGLCGTPPHWSIHKESADTHSGEAGLPACICTLHGGVDNSRYEPEGVLEGPRRGKQSGEINKDKV